MKSGERCADRFDWWVLRKHRIRYNPASRTYRDETEKLAHDSVDLCQAVYVVASNRINTILWLPRPLLEALRIIVCQKNVWTTISGIVLPANSIGRFVSCQSNKKRLAPLYWSIKWTFTLMSMANKSLFEQLILSIEDCMPTLLPISINHFAHSELAPIARRIHHILQTNNEKNAKELMYELHPLFNFLGKYTKMRENISANSSGKWSTGHLHAVVDTHMERGET